MKPFVEPGGSNVDFIQLLDDVHCRRGASVRRLIVRIHGSALRVGGAVVIPAMNRGRERGGRAPGMDRINGKPYQRSTAW